MIDKKEGREISLKFLFCQEFSTDENSSSFDTEARIKHFKQSFKSSDESWQAALRIIKAVCEKRDYLDDTFKSHLQNWSLERISLTDKNILRIATAEILFLDTPPKVAIDEAIELSKKYSTKESASFINGVLDAVLSQVNEGNL